MPTSDASQMNFGSGGNAEDKAWKDIWGWGQGIGAVTAIVSAGDLVERLSQEYSTAKAKLVNQD